MPTAQAPKVPVWPSPLKAGRRGGDHLAKDVVIEVNTVEQMKGIGAADLPRPPESGDIEEDRAEVSAALPLPTVKIETAALPRPPEPNAGALFEKFVTLCGKPEVYAALLKAGWKPEGPGHG